MNKGSEEPAGKGLSWDFVWFCWEKRVGGVFGEESFVISFFIFINRIVIVRIVFLVVFL